jgi:choline dehydrogenase-like flavoprotein
MAHAEWDVIVVGSGAGGGIVASRLAGRGFRVLLIEAGGHHQAGSFSRWELQASKTLWNRPKFAQTRADGSRPISMVSVKSLGVV